MELVAGLQRFVSHGVLHLEVGCSQRRPLDIPGIAALLFSDAADQHQFLKVYSISECSLNCKNYLEKVDSKLFSEGCYGRYVLTLIRRVVDQKRCLYL